jgi:aspartate racemase
MALGRRRMKTIGLIGGMSWESTAEYYRIINELIAQKLGGLHSGRIVLFSVDFEEIERTQVEGRWDEAATILAGAATALERAGAAFLLICTNTMHKVASEVAKGTRLPLLHIGEVTGAAIAQQGMRRVGLLGTRFVMEEGFYREALEERFGLQVLVPSEKGMDAVHGIIYGELCKGEIEDSSRRTCVQIIGDMVQHGAEGIVLGCTELPMLIRQEDVDVPLFDTTRLHAEAAVEVALDEPVA